MKYQIEITGMYCTGCSNLIKICMEDQGLLNVEVDQVNNTAVFESKFSDLSIVKKLLENVFGEIPEYSYSNIESLGTS